MSNRWKILVVAMLGISLSIQAQTDVVDPPTDKKDDPYAEEDLYEDDPYFWSYSKEIGLNVTGLASKFVPFNLGDTDAGPIGLKWKKYYATRAFRVNFGTSINENSDLGFSSLYLSLGFEKRYPIAKSRKLTYSSGWDGVLMIDSDNESAFIGASKSYSIEYYFTKRLFISTEAALKIGIGDEVPIVSFDPPVAIFLHVRLY